MYPLSTYMYILSKRKKKKNFPSKNVIFKAIKFAVYCIGMLT